MTSLGEVINWQKLEYDFNFHKQVFNTDLTVLVLSEGKSMIKVGSFINIYVYICNIHVCNIYVCVTVRSIYYD